MKIVFFGSSDFSIPVLSALAKNHTIVQVVTTPERKKGRGQKISGTIVKDFALSRQLPVSEPEKLSNPDFVNQIKSLNPDFVIIASYGKLVPSSVFTLPKIAALNVHPSLLPRHRGASPIQRTILEGDQETGVSIAEITKDLDAGDLFAQTKTKVDPDETANQLSERLSKTAADLILKLIDEMKSGKIIRQPQDHSKHTYAKKIEKEEGKINWTASSKMIHNQIRGFYPWPGAFTFFQGKRLKILESLVSNTKASGAPGAVHSLDQQGITVQTGSGLLQLKRVQLEGRNEMGAHEFALGQRIKIGDRFE